MYGVAGGGGLDRWSYKNQSIKLNPLIKTRKISTQKRYRLEYESRLELMDIQESQHK